MGVTSIARISSFPCFANKNPKLGIWMGSADLIGFADKNLTIAIEVSDLHAHNDHSLK